MGGVDVDGDNLVTILDLFLVVTIWFAFSLSCLSCYFCFDTYDRMKRNSDIEKEVIDDYDRLGNEDNEDSETDEGIVETLL